MCSCEEDSSSFRNVLFIWYGVCFFKTVEKVLLITSDVLLNDNHLGVYGCLFPKT